MMDFILVDGDKARFDTIFGHRTLLGVAEGTIKGSGHAKIAGKKVCVAGDEKSVIVQNVSYSVPGYNPGKGILTIQALQPNQQSLIYSSMSRKVLLKGIKFQAMFVPTQPAMSINPPGNPEANLAPTQGTGQFINNQKFVKSS